MDFNYHPILGLQFTCGINLYEINLDAFEILNANYKNDWTKALELMNQKGIQFVSSLDSTITQIYTYITTNAY